jgi:hypothetical protein
MPTIPSTEVINNWSTDTGYISGSDTLETFRKKANGLAVVVAEMSTVLSVVVKTTAYTITALDRIVICNSAAPFTVTLPTAVSSSGRQFIIKNKGTGIVTVDGTSSGLIDGANTTTIPQYSSVTIVSDGTTWNNV